MIDRVNTEILIGVDKATKKAAQALERVTDRLVGEADNPVDQGVTIRLNSKYAENYLEARNAQDSISYYQTRDGFLDGITNGLMRLRDLSMQMGSPILNESDKANIRQEAGMISDLLRDTANAAEFNGNPLISDMSLSAMGIDGFDVGADNALSTIDSAIQYVTSKRAETGARINTLEARIDNFATNNESLAKSIEARSGSLMEDIVELTESVNQALVSVKAADLVLDLNKEKVKSLLEMM